MIILFAAAALAAAEPAPPPAEDPVATLAAVQDMYNQSCRVKAYAAYDDLCDALRKQIREAERASDDAARKSKAKPKPAAVAAQPVDASANAGVAR